MMYRRQMHSSTRSFSTVAAKSEGGSGSIAKFFAMVAF